MNNTTDDKKVILYIPLGINTRVDYYPGFGKKEILQASVGAVLGLILGIMGYLITNLTLTAIIIILVFLVGSVTATTKNSINISIVDYIGFAMKYSKERKVYPYRQLEEWE